MFAELNYFRRFMCNNQPRASPDIRVSAIVGSATNI
jgi:hypothetical protein